MERRFQSYKVHQNRTLCSISTKRSSLAKKSHFFFFFAIIISEKKIKIEDQKSIINNVVFRNRPKYHSSTFPPNFDRIEGVEGNVRF